MHGRFSIIGGTCPGWPPKSTPMCMYKLSSYTSYVHVRVSDTVACIQIGSLYIHVCKYEHLCCALLAWYHEIAAPGQSERKNTLPAYIEYWLLMKSWCYKNSSNTKEHVGLHVRHPQFRIVCWSRCDWNWLEENDGKRWRWEVEKNETSGRQKLELEKGWRGGIV